MSWSRDQVTMLIEEFKKWPVLYAVKSKEYKNKHARLQALENIQINMKTVKSDVTISDIKTKFNGLRTNFMTEHKKHKSSQKSGAGEDDIYYPTLWYYKYLLFLLDHNTTRESVDSIGIDTDELKLKNISSTEIASSTALNSDCSKQSEADIQHISDTEELINDDNEREMDRLSTLLQDESEQLSDHIGTYDLRDNTLVSTDIIPPVKSKIEKKKRKRDINDDMLLKQTSAAMNAITTAIKQCDTNVVPETRYASDNVFGDFVCSKLEQISDPIIRLEAEQKITTVLFDSILRSRNVNK